MMMRYQVKYRLQEDCSRIKDDDRQFEVKAAVVSVDVSLGVTKTGQCHSLLELPFFQNMQELALCTLPFLAVFYCRKCTLNKFNILPKVSLVALVSELGSCEPGTRWR